MGAKIMGTPSPFEVAHMVGNKGARTLQNLDDTRAIDRILMQANQSENPQVLQDSIGKILSQVSPENQQNALQYLGNRYQALQQAEAARRGGYDQFAPAGVQTQQAKNTHQMNAFNQIRGMGQPSQPSTLGHPDQTQAQALNPPGTVAESDQVPQPRNQPTSKPQSQGGIQDVSDADLVAMHAISSLKPSAEAEQKRRQELRNREIEFHKESAKYDEDLLHKSKVAKAQIQTINDIDRALKSGNIKPSSYANMFKGFGKVGDKISEALINKDEAALQASIPQLLEGWKDVFGVRLSDADLKLLQDKLPSIGKSPEANRAILKILHKYGEMSLLRGDIARDIKKANGGIRPLGYADQIEERFDQMIAPVKIINPETGNTIEIPAYKVSDAIAAGGKLAPQEQ